MGYTACGGFIADMSMYVGEEVAAFLAGRAIAPEANSSAAHVNDGETEMRTIFQSFAEDL